MNRAILGATLAGAASDRPCFQAGRRRPGDFGRERRELRVVYARIGRCQGRPAWRGAQAAVARPYPAVTCHMRVNGGSSHLRAATVTRHAQRCS
jgi:hypothetical protein